MRTLLAFLIALSFSLLIPTNADAQIKNGDWPQWRGPGRDAIATEKGLLTEWPKGGPTLLWDTKKVNKDRTVGLGLSSLVHRGR